MLPIILGSSSKSRHAILAQAGIPFTHVSPNIDEKQVAPEKRSDPSQYALAVAHAKMDALLSQSVPPSSILITCDQVVSWNGQVREKPQSPEECKVYLRGYSTQPAETHAALVVFNTSNGKRVSGVDVARQYFDEIPDHIMDKLIQKGDVMHCCGGFMIDDDLLLPYLKKREGDADSIIGLPMRLLNSLLEQVK